MAVTWNARNAAHLLRRATFGGTPAEIERSLELGLDATVDALLDTSIPDTALETRLQRENFDLSEPVGIIRWWLTRMIHSRHQLRERMTLFLHDHFATSLVKVRQTELMVQQNELFRSMAFGSFTDLTIAVSRDPAMLLWLDNYTNRKEHPNENYARELLELFTIGHQVYTEDDVLAAARAFTGWSLDRGTLQFRFYPFHHDYGEKTFLGITGNHDGDDIVRIVCDRREHAMFLTEKVFSHFAYPDPEPETVEKFADVYQGGGNNLGDLIRAILTSDEMYGERALWSRVKSPVEHAVAAVRMLEVDEEVSRLVLNVVHQQNQIPFAPPTVDGWPTGLSWINSTTLLARMNLGRYLGVAAAPLVAEAGDADPVGAVAERFGVDRSDPVIDETLRSYWDSLEGTHETGRRAGLIQIALSLPDWQLN